MHLHRVATYDERGVQTTGGAVLLILAEFCPGGSLQEHLNLLLAAPSSPADHDVNTRMGSSKDRALGRQHVEQNNDDTISDSTDKCDRTLVGAKSKEIHESDLKAIIGETEGVAFHSVRNSSICGTRHRDKADRGPGVDRATETATVRAGAKVPTRRMEAWVKQVRQHFLAICARLFFLKFS